MASALTWLDHSEAQRRRMMEIVHLFREQGTVDELGVGSIRDALSDTLFPGTSTLHTRARYLLFVPWIYQRVEREGVPADRVGARVREDEVRLIYALENGGERQGVVGIEARERLTRFPSELYWGALRVFGIRGFSGSVDQYEGSLDSFRQRARNVLHADDGEIAEGTSVHNWHPRLPDEPEEDFLESTTFELRETDAEYLQERILDRATGACLAHLVSQPSLDADAAAPWLHPAIHEAPSRVADAVEHARCFSELMHGAALLYNLMLSEKVRDARAVGDEFASVSDETRPQDLVDDYTQRLEGWQRMASTRITAHRDWFANAHRFWELVEKRQARVTPRTRDFVERWIGRAMQTEGAVASDGIARELVRNREIQIKRGRARLDNHRALERWNGASGTGQLTFRWTQALRIARDIVGGLR